MPPGPVTVACIQSMVRVPPGRGLAAEKLQENVYRNASYIDFFSRHTNRGPKIVALPELFLQGHDPLRDDAGWFELAIDPDGPELEPFRSACRTYQVYVAGSAAFRTDGSGTWRHSRFLMTPTGEVVMDDGEATPVLDTEYGRLVCASPELLEIPEGIRTLAVQGAEIVLMPIYEPFNDRQRARDALRLTRAYENSVYLVSVNQGLAVVPPRPGMADDPLAGERFDSRGQSQIIDFLGRIQMIADGAGETMITGGVDASAVRRHRAEAGEPVVGGRDLVRRATALADAARGSAHAEAPAGRSQPEFGSTAVAPLT